MSDFELTVRFVSIDHKDRFSVLMETMTIRQRIALRKETFFMFLMYLLLLLLISRMIIDCKSSGT